IFQKPIFFLQEGRHTLSYWSVDHVGNKEPEKAFQVFSVSRLPQAKMDVAGNVVNTGGVNYASPDLSIKLYGENAAIGLDRIEVKMGDKDFQPYFSPIRLTDAGSYSIQYRAVDRLGNVEPTKTYRVTVVEKAPQTSMATAQPLVRKDDVAYSPAPNVVTFNVDGSTVGIKHTLVSVNDGPFQPYTGPITLGSDQKVIRLAYKSVDLLGNEEPVKYATFHMMRAEPVVNLFVTNGQSAEEEVRTNFLDTPGQQRAPASVPTAPPPPANR
ncbi:MAG: hypothetical protein HUU37_05240, partial [Bdellovibrionales bacterium]|nr:hypothetical protein [Bdellovibrionales bacterium]